MARKSTSDWLPRVLFESFLITISILVALAFDEWRENREDEETVQQALSNFVSEMEQNKARIDYAAPLTRGLLSVLSNHNEAGDINSVDEFLQIIESYEFVYLHTTAWETALATGSIAKMKYNLVSALSLTYSLQSRYQVSARSGLTELTNFQNLSEGQLEFAIYNAIRYLNDISNMESELIDTYSVASTNVQTAIDAAGGDPN